MSVRPDHCETADTAVDRAVSLIDHLLAEGIVPVSASARRGMKGVQVLPVVEIDVPESEIAAARQALAEVGVTDLAEVGGDLDGTVPGAGGDVAVLVFSAPCKPAQRFSSHVLSQVAETLRAAGGTLLCIRLWPGASGGGDVEVLFSAPEYVPVRERLDAVWERHRVRSVGSVRGCWCCEGVVVEVSFVRSFTGPLDIDY